MVEARRTEATASWAARLQVVDWGGLSSTVARENPQVALFSPPVRTRTWFHTGAWRQQACLELAYADEYWAGDPSAPDFPPCGLPADLTPVEHREAARALKGKVLRQEVFADDGTAEAVNPYGNTRSPWSPAMPDSCMIQAHCTEIWR